MPHPSSVLSPHEHLRQLHHVYGPLSPAFVAEELHCTLAEAVEHLYGPHASRYCWVNLADLADLAAVGLAGLKRWVRQHHLQCAPQRGRGRTAPPYLHLEDAHHLLSLMPETQKASANALPRVKGSDLGSAAITQQALQTTVDVNWQLARQAMWPMTVERLAEAVYSSWSPTAQQRTRSLLRTWEAQGKVVCFARGLYDLVRPVLVLDPERFGRSVLAKEELQKLRAHHLELAHWPGGSLAAAWRAYSRFYASPLLAVADRAEPTFLEYLLVRQLNPVWVPGEVDARYEELCQEAAFYRLVPAPPQSVSQTERPPLTVENIEAGLIDFRAAAEATRLKMQRTGSKGQRPGSGQKTTASSSRSIQERI